MKCPEARELLIPHLNNEITRSERELLQSHLAECEGCWREFNALSSTQMQVRRGMAEYAATARPTDLAWPKLQHKLHAQGMPARVQWSGRRIAPGLSTLIATASAALLIFGGLIAPAALNRPSASLAPTQTLAANPSIHYNSIVLADDPTPPQTAPLGTLFAPGNASDNADESRLSDIEMRLLKNLGKNSRASRAQTEIIYDPDDDGVDRLSTIPYERNLLRKANGNAHVYDAVMEINCRACTRKE